MWGVPGGACGVDASGGPGASRRRVPHGHQTRPDTKQSTVFIIIFSDRHSLGWARGGHEGGRAVGGPVQLRANNRRGTASPANLPRLHGCLPRRLMISHYYIMILSAQGGRGSGWNRGPVSCLVPRVLPSSSTPPLVACVPPQSCLSDWALFGVLVTPVTL